eukprot:gnl/Spiro4/22856_TR11273_c0_g1_i2.p1 gnl/Spiro4/22856_TR11273_c0_g1~~gnl/Spiro4/22856_TR11273_c0_g1_i2.p1  ORF type:complete len:167 (+),score=34.91 gnl/Spiro4/22856_TR11273_c0_g1_i2:47-502(+)
MTDVEPATDAAQPATDTTQPATDTAQPATAAELTLLPLATVSRVLKSSLPDNVHIAKEAKTSFARSATFFVHYVTTIANQLCRESKRLTVTSGDVMRALEELDFHDLVPALQEFQESQRNKSSATDVAEDDRPSSEAQGPASMAVDVTADG